VLKKTKGTKHPLSPHNNNNKKKKTEEKNQQKKFSSRRSLASGVEGCRRSSSIHPHQVELMRGHQVF
jgi:hypothetical protein